MNCRVLLACDVILDGARRCGHLKPYHESGYDRSVVRREWSASGSTRCVRGIVEGLLRHLNKNADFPVSPIMRSKLSRSAVLDEIELSVPRLPQAFDGLRIAHLSDLHLTYWNDRLSAKQTSTRAAAAAWTRSG